MATKTIITCAVTGGITSPSQHPKLPVTPEQTAAACLEAAAAGAAICHIHVRDLTTTKQSMDLALYREVVERIRGSGVDLVLNLTTGPGQRFIPSPEDPKVAASGTTLMRPEPRVTHVQALRPEICSLDFNTMYSGSSVVINTPESITRMAELIREAGTKPELEVFDSGDIHLARKLLADGVIDSPPLFQIVLGMRYGFDAAPETLLYARDLLPAGCHWAAFGIGRAEFPMLAQTLLLGGHVRVGMEDNIYISRGVLTPGNGALVERAVKIIELLGSNIASPAEARTILGLPSPQRSVGT
jgi:3-dehydrocarnitine:acetyl-CoA trimethylamine transferase